MIDDADEIYPEGMVERLLAEVNTLGVQLAGCYPPAVLRAPRPGARLRLAGKFSTTQMPARRWTRERITPTVIGLCRACCDVASERSAPRSLRLYEDEIRSVEGPDALRGGPAGTTPFVPFSSSPKASSAPALPIACGSHPAGVLRWFAWWCPVARRHLRYQKDAPKC